MSRVFERNEPAVVGLTHHPTHHVYPHTGRANIIFLDLPRADTRSEPLWTPYTCTSIEPMVSAAGYASGRSLLDLAPEGPRPMSETKRVAAQARKKRLKRHRRRGY